MKNKIKNVQNEDNRRTKEMNGKTNDILDFFKQLSNHRSSVEKRNRTDAVQHSHDGEDYNERLTFDCETSHLAHMKSNGKSKQTCVNAVRMKHLNLKICENIY